MGPNPLVDSRDVRFVLFEMLESDKLNKYPTFADFDKDIMEDSLNLAENIALDKFYPSNVEGDQIGSKYNPDTKEVKVPECIHEAVNAFTEAGFIALRFPQEDGGMGMPVCITSACKEVLGAANTTAGMYPGLSEGVVDMILQCGTEEQKAIYAEKMLSGEWGGTMCLTEADAGSDVGALTTKAVKQDDGTYLITGQKIFITGCDHDITPNIIHAVLARVEGDPEGTKGISIFIVPKIRVNEDGSLGEPNDVICTGLEHKMGINVSSTGTLAFGDNGNCKGYLLGEQCKGLNVMFILMNEARIGVGLQGLGLSSTAYMHAVTYAKNRVQGPDISKAMEANPPKVPIINHPDVKRMLLWQKSYVEGMRMLCYYLAYCMDIHHVADGDEAKEAMGIVELLTPILKAGNSDMSWLITSDAMQVYGGYGYTKDYPIEQLCRDAKISAIYEGANGIQAMDLIMRKILMNKEQYNLKTWRKKAEETIANAKGIVDDKYIDVFDRSLKKLDDVIQHLQGLMAEMKIYNVLALAQPLLKAMHTLALAWVHLWSLTLTVPKMKEIIGDKKGADRDKLLEDNMEAAYYSGKVLSSQSFIGTELPKFFGMAEAILFDDASVVKATQPIFSGTLDE